MSVPSFKPLWRSAYPRHQESDVMNVFGCRPMPDFSACTTGRRSKTADEGTRGEQGTSALSAYGDFGKSGSERAAALGFERPRMKPGQSVLEAWPVPDRRRCDGDRSAKQARFSVFKQAPPLPAFERRLELAIDALETVLARIMTYRTPLAGIAFCADGKPLRSARR
jgi:hypothetical protein